MTTTRMPLFLSLLLTLTPPVSLGAEETFPPYQEPKAVLDFFFAHPAHISNGLYWLRSFMNPLTESPYDMAPEFIDIVVVSHGTEIATLVKHNYEKYRDQVERMRYYASLGVRFKACSLAATDYGYAADSFYDFVEIVPSAMTEIVHWQQQGYGLLIPQVHEKTLTIEQIR